MKDMVACGHCRLVSHLSNPVRAGVYQATSLDSTRIEKVTVLVPARRHLGQQHAARGVIAPRREQVRQASDMVAKMPRRSCQIVWRKRNKMGVKFVE